MLIRIFSALLITVFSSTAFALVITEEYTRNNIFNFENFEASYTGGYTFYVTFDETINYTGALGYTPSITSISDNTGGLFDYDVDSANNLVYVDVTGDSAGTGSWWLRGWFKSDPSSRITANDDALWFSDSTIEDQNIAFGGGLSYQLVSTTTQVTEPNSFMLLGLGFAALGIKRKK